MEIVVHDSISVGVMRYDGVWGDSSNDGEDRDEWAKIKEEGKIFRQERRVKAFIMRSGSPRGPILVGFADIPVWK